MQTQARTVQIEELARDDGWSPLRLHFDVQSFGVNAFTANEAGGRLIGEHDEIPSGHEELYLITTGLATFTIDGEEIEAGPGTVVYVADPAVKRGAVAQEAGTTVFAVGGKPGEVYKPRSWETNAQVLPLFEQGEFVEAKRMLNEALGRYDDREALLYNLACAEAKLGETDQAFEHLAAALAGRPDFTELARGDDDLAALRDDARFAELVPAES
jgi:tetratricopeptide (TPR) repeat protein